MHGGMYVHNIPLERPSEKVLMDVAQPWVIFPPALKYCQAVDGQAKTDTPGGMPTGLAGTRHLTRRLGLSFL